MKYRIIVTEIATDDVVYRAEIVNDITKLMMALRSISELGYGDIEYYNISVRTI